jgi:hypothetical protein
MAANPCLGEIWMTVAGPMVIRADAVAKRFV